ncbi:MAG: PAS domain S-box protein [Bacteroidota bacterium]|nr:PAS domain S-box protein [Bacteroidota bacterium]
MVPQEQLNSPHTPGSELQLQLEKLNTIFNSLREIIFTVDIEKKMIENVNGSIELLGYQKSEWEKQVFTEWTIGKRKKFADLIKHASRSKTEATSQLVFLPTKDEKELVPFEFSTVLYTFKGSKYLLCVLRDVTEREKLLKDLEQSLQKERELNELRSGFVSTASHQFRTPLTIIQSGIDIMDMYLEDLPEEKQRPFQRQFKRIQGEVERLQSLMSDILLLGRTYASRTPFQPELRDLVEFCKELMVQKFNNRYPINRWVLLEVMGKEQPVLFDPKLMDHALENIISNAYKYSEKGHIDMNVVFEYDKVSIAITDHGIGIPQADLAHLFQPFYRASNTTEIQGTGLGLAIVKDYIDIHGGQIFVISEENHGTTVTILLPLNNIPLSHATKG